MECAIKNFEFIIPFWLLTFRFYLAQFANQFTNRSINPPKLHPDSRTEA